MPYTVVHLPGGRCRVKKRQPGRPRWFSRKAIPCARATRQQRALYRAERLTRRRPRHQ